MTPSPIDAALPVICAFVWIVPPPSVSEITTLAFACPWPPASFDLTLIATRWASASCSTISTVPVNVIDIAPIFTLISALTESGPVRLEHTATLDARHHALEVEDRRVALVRRLAGGEWMLQDHGHMDSLAFTDRTLAKLYSRRMSREDVLIRAGRLAEEGKPYVLATVVRVERPASTRPGDRALVSPQGDLDGWVGGACSEPIVIREALRALVEGEPRLVRIGPPDSGGEVAADIVIAESSCASEGVVEVLIEPQLPRPLLAILGDGQAALSLGELARTIDWRVTTELTPDADAVVVATMGHADEEALESALANRAGYVGLVASARRAAVVLGRLRERGVSEDALARVRSPAGLDLGPATQPEIAVAILAELVAWRHTRGTGESVLQEAVDPVCGMTVAVGSGEAPVVHEGVSYYFCCAGCRSRFEAEPSRYVTATDAAGR